MSVVLLERPVPSVALLRLNRPEVMNALNMETRRALAAHFQALSDDDGVRVVVVTGAGKAFAAGADLRDVAEATPVDMMLRNVERLWAAVADCPKPVIAAVNGYALGAGCELAMHCDIVLAAESAEFGQPEIRVGIMPGAGGTQRLVRLVGKHRAMHLLLTGQRIPAAEALAMGLASEVVADDAIEARALELAERIAAMSPLVARQIKEVVLGGMDASLDTALLLERKAYHMLFGSHDQREGMQAFLDKRKPTFEGH